MEYDRIPSQIDGISNRRLLSCVAKYTLIVLVIAIVFGLMFKHSHDRATRAMEVFGLGGLIFGLVAARLDPAPRRILHVPFIVIPILASAIMFAMRTLFGHADHISLPLVLTPASFTAGFLLGLSRRPRA